MTYIALKGRALNKRCGHFESKADGAQEPECISNT